MALAERMLAARFGAIVDHRTWAIAGDGCLMEGISHEAASLAGHLRLNRLIVLFDDNSISIDGPTSLARSEDTLKRFDACRWAVERVDGHDNDAVAAAIERAMASDRPSLIACRTVIGLGAPGKQGTAAVHGAPLGKDEVAAARAELGWPHAPFEIPDDIAAAWRAAGARGAARRSAWQAACYRLEDEERIEFERRMTGDVSGLARTATARHVAGLLATAQPMATRKASELALEALTAAVPELIGGSADLTGSNNTRTAAMKDIAPGDYAGSYVRYGVREHAMAAAMNGIAAHGGAIPYGGSFLAFTDYCRPSIRLAALMGLRTIFVMTHDSIGLGEDGPTHQPVEHVPSLRMIPNLNVFRPADAVETAECWELALAGKTTPAILVLTRQDVGPVRTAAVDGNPCERGAYVLQEAGGPRRATILASGSEVTLAVAARDLLEAEGVGTRVVSVPCLELFDLQDKAYRRAILDRNDVLLAVEAAAPGSWPALVGDDGAVIAMNGFGASAPGPRLYEHFGITADAIAGAIRERLRDRTGRTASLGR